MLNLSEGTTYSKLRAWFWLVAWEFCLAIGCAFLAFRVCSSSISKTFRGWVQVGLIKNGILCELGSFFLAGVRSCDVGT